MFSVVAGLDDKDIWSWTIKKKTTTKMSHFSKYYF